MKKLLPYILILLISFGFWGTPITTKAQGVCTVNSAGFNPSGKQPDRPTTPPTPWFNEQSPPIVQVIVKTTNCTNKNLKFSLTGIHNLPIGDLEVSELKGTPIPVQKDSFIIKLSAGETGCVSSGFGPNCAYYIRIYDENNNKIYSSKEGGEVLSYNCLGICNKSWTLNGIVFGNTIQEATRNYVSLPGSQNSANTETKYTPLAPIPPFLPDAPYDTAGSATNPCPFGKYLNIMIKILTGFAAVLAMLMIVAGGLQYMTNELISSKEAGKERIRNAILGLLLILGAYTLLNTINPALLNVCLSLDKVQITIEGETGVLGKTATVDGKTITACVEADMITMNLFGHSVRINKALQANLERVNARWLAIPAANRYQVNTVEGYVCKPVTNKPGYWSAHAFGLAIDINAATNPYGPTLKTDMKSPPSYPSYPFANVFASEGWGWGGNWSTIKDAMHFSKYPLAEQGNGKLN